MSLQGPLGEWKGTFRKPRKTHRGVCRPSHSYRELWLQCSFKEVIQLAVPFVVTGRVYMCRVPADRLRNRVACVGRGQGMGRGWGMGRLPPPACGLGARLAFSSFYLPCCIFCWLRAGHWRGAQCGDGGWLWVPRGLADGLRSASSPWSTLCAWPVLRLGGSHGGF